MNQNNPFDKDLQQKALEFHQKHPSGKIQVVSSKKIETEQDLSLAYSPGVAFPCEEIAKNPLSAFDYTSRGNLVAVITNGTAVLGLGNIGPLAAKPVMEGKGVLFKHFAGIDVFDIELKAQSVDEFVRVCRSLEPSFGGINLEDISAPECFEIERRLEEELSIPVFHDDQHGTAIITCSAMINACLIAQKKIEEVQIVFSGAGSAAIACGHLLAAIGVPLKHITMCDSKGVIYKGRSENMNPYKQAFAQETNSRTLAEAIQDKDVFIGLSRKNILTEKMIQSMRSRPFIFAMANPDPEIHPDLARKACPEAVIATGRSDFPNQVNNVLGFPSIFRAALDVRATHITKEMKIAAAYALAELAREDVPESVSLAYGGESFHFGKNYIIPKPFDHRVVTTVAPAVAKAAMESGSARKKIENLEQYRLQLSAIQGPKKIFVRKIVHQIKTHLSKSKEPLPKIIFSEGLSKRVLKAVNAAVKEKMFTPVFLGPPDEVKNLIHRLQLNNLNHLEIQNPLSSPKLPDYAEKLFEMRKSKGFSQKQAEELIKDPNYFGAMSVHLGCADGLITGTRKNYAESIRPVLQVIGCPKNQLASGMNIVLVRDKTFIFADTTVNINPAAEQIAQIAVQSMNLAQMLCIDPRIAMLSFTNFTAKEQNPKKMKTAVEIFKQKYPHVKIDGEMQADTAVNPNIIKYIFPFSSMQEGANILIFPSLDAGNIAYKLVQQLGEGKVIGPLLMGVNRPVDVVQRTGTVDDVVHTIVFTLLKIQNYKKSLPHKG